MHPSVRLAMGIFGVTAILLAVHYYTYAVLWHSPISCDYITEYPDGTKVCQRVLNGELSNDAKRAKQYLTKEQLCPQPQN